MFTWRRKGARTWQDFRPQPTLILYTWLRSWITQSTNTNPPLCWLACATHPIHLYPLAKINEKTMQLIFHTNMYKPVYNMSCRVLRQCYYIFIHILYKCKDWFKTDTNLPHGEVRAIDRKGKWHIETIWLLQSVSGLCGPVSADPHIWLAGVSSTKNG